MDIYELVEEVEGNADWRLVTGAGSSLPVRGTVGLMGKWADVRTVVP